VAWEKAVDRRKVGRWVGGFSLLAVLGLMLWRYAYPVAITALVAPSASWTRASSVRTRADVYAMLGKPDESACAKDYENWRVEHWWGTEQLKILAEGCEMGAKVGSVYYILRVDGFYEPAAIRVLR